MNWKNPETGEFEVAPPNPPKMEATFNENIAILTGGPSLVDSWHNGMYPLFHTVWAINMVGRLDGPAPFIHDYLYYLDTPQRIMGTPEAKQHPTTMKGYRDRKPLPIDKECSITFPACFDYVMRTSRASARVFIFGWDCAGKGVVDGKPWEDSRNECERRLMAKYWNAEKVAGVCGSMRTWAEKELGFNAGPINQWVKPCPPPRTPAEARKEENARMI